MIRHALAEGWLLLRQRAGVSIVLSLALAVPISLAGVGLTLHQWLAPVAVMSEQTSTVAILLHPRMDEQQRRQWIEGESAAHPEWTVSEVPSEQLVERLKRWFPYLEDLMTTGDATLPPLIEIVTADPDSVAILEGRHQVLAVGPRSSIQQTLGRSARSLGWMIAGLSVVLLAGALLLAAVWVHLELYRHSDEITIMRLVGATERTIRGPFLVAVAVPGAVAGALAVAGSLATVAGLSRLTLMLGLPEIQISATTYVLQVLTGLILPLVVSVVTLARHATVELEG
jgi:cell division transport system permease protein